MFQQYYQSYSEQFIRTIRELDFAVIDQIMRKLDQARMDGKKLFVIGNGGSACSASHWATDFGKGVNVGNMARFRISSLADHTGWMTALANDLAYAEIFREPLKNLLDPGDVVIGLSVSGNSENAVRAFEYARSVGAYTIALVGAGESRMRQLADLALVIPSTDYGIVEDVHMFVNHVISQYLRREYERRQASGELK
jgi:D-sedoheptulose 7-phosphate isomerase